MQSVSIDYKQLLRLIQQQAPPGTDLQNGREYAGKLEWVPGDGWQLKDLSVGSKDGMHSRIHHRWGEKSAITFHTHVLQPEEEAEYVRGMPVDLPSGQDITSITKDTILHGLERHLLFTPGYTYLIGLSPALRTYLKKGNLSRSLGSKGDGDLSSWLWYHIVYHWKGALPKFHPQYAEQYDYAWIKYLRKVGFIVKRVPSSQSIQFEVEMSSEEEEGGGFSMKERTLYFIIAVIVVIVIGGLFFFWSTSTA